MLHTCRFWLLHDRHGAGARDKAGACTRMRGVVLHPKDLCCSSRAMITLGSTEATETPSSRAQAASMNPRQIAGLSNSAYHCTLAGHSCDAQRPRYSCPLFLPTHQNSLLGSPDTLEFHHRDFRCASTFCRPDNTLACYLQVVLILALSFHPFGYLGWLTIPHQGQRDAPS